MLYYEQAGADEVVSLNYDSGDLDDFASMTIDRNSASQGSDVHLVITDNQLNIDPTAEDVVIFYVADGRPNSDKHGTTIPNGVSFTNSTLIYNMVTTRLSSHSTTPLTTTESYLSPTTPMVENSIFVNDTHSRRHRSR